MSSMVKDGGFVYNYGTPAGRSGEVRLSRAPEGAILDLSAYEYWNGSGWILADPAAAVPVMDGRIGEVSVQYNEFLGKFVAMYADAFSSIVMRTAPSPVGPWTAPETLVNLVEVPRYLRRIHPPVVQWFGSVLPCHHVGRLQRHVDAYDARSLIRLTLAFAGDTRSPR